MMILLRILMLMLMRLMLIRLMLIKVILLLNKRCVITMTKQVKLRTGEPFHGVIHARDSRDNACLT